jgi:hypothetical protein
MVGFGERMQGSRKRSWTGTASWRIRSEDLKMYDILTSSHLKSIELLRTIAAQVVLVVFARKR